MTKAKTPHLKSEMWGHMTHSLDREAIKRVRVILKRRLLARVNACPSELA
jgi:hypothetical protein